jgi:putative endonuclease
LQAEGYEIIAHNWRTARGEIDLIARAGDLFVFVEVKTRRGRSAGTPEEGMTAHKARQLFNLAQAYFYEQNIEDADWRIDLVAVELDYQGRLLRCEHVPHAVPTW